MTPDLLSRVGVALWGQQWTGPMAAAIGVNHRTVRRWASGQDTPPDGIWDDLALALLDRRTHLSDLHAAVTTGPRP